MGHEETGSCMHSVHRLWFDEPCSTIFPKLGCRIPESILLYNKMLRVNYAHKNMSAKQLHSHTTHGSYRLKKTPCIWQYWPRMTKIHPSKTTELKGNEQVSGQKSKITVKGEVESITGDLAGMVYTKRNRLTFKERSKPDKDKCLMICLVCGI